jgi:hypothetical protein
MPFTMRLPTSSTLMFLMAPVAYRTCAQHSMAMSEESENWM